MNESAPLPSGRFGAILCDAPWCFQTWSPKGRGRSPDKHYPTLAAGDIYALPVQQLAADDCALFLWVVWPMLEQGLKTIAAWGFQYKTCAFDWMKADNRQPDLFQEELPAQVGMGYWTRANSEPCLLGTRGNPERRNADVRQGIIAPRREHSRKPDGIHERIERLVAGPYLELFARQTRPGWSAWGNEVSKFDRRRYSKRVHAPCFDCDVDTLAADGDWYMVHNHVWAAAWPDTKQNGFIELSEILCLRCLERRLGRALTPADFNDAPINRHILARRFGSSTERRETWDEMWAKPFHRPDAWDGA